jgi:hypothetical protein
MRVKGIFRIVVALLLLPLLLGVASADAKKKHKKPKSPPVTTVSASKSTSSDSEQVTVTATCPGGLIAVGGGFLNPAAFDMGSPTDLNIVFESRRASDTSWQVSAVREQTGDPGPELPLTAIVDCRSAKLTAKKVSGKKADAAKKKKAKKLRITEVSASATAPPTTGTQATASAACPPGSEALGGGFSSSPAPVLSNPLSYPIFWANFRASPSSWAASFTNAGTTAHTVISYAYCATGLKIAETSADVALAGSAGTASTAIAATPPCPKGKAQLGGGFNNTPAANGSAIALLMGSSPVNGSWQVNAFNFSPVAGTLGSRAYCA